MNIYKKDFKKNQERIRGIEPDNINRSCTINTSTQTNKINEYIKKEKETKNRNVSEESNSRNH